MHEYIHTKIHTYKHLKIHSFTLVHTHYILYIYSSIFLLRIHTIHTTYIATLFQQHLRLRLRRLVFLPVAVLLFTFQFFLFLDWAKNITHMYDINYDWAKNITHTYGIISLFFENYFQFSSRLGYSLSTISSLLLQMFKRFKYHGALYHRKWSPSMVFLKV